MSTQIRFRRGSTAQHAAFTGALAEITVDTDKKTAVIHDGGTAGGIPLAREDGKNDGALGFQQDTKVNDYTVLVGDIGKMLVGNKATAINFPLSAAATLTSKFVAGFKNIGVGAMTVTPNGAELIDGVNAAITIPTGASVVIKGDGSSFRTYFSNGDVTGNAINNAAALTGANLADNDKLGVYDVSAGSLVSILVSELIAGIFKTARKIANAYFLSSFRLWDATDNTKGLGFDLSGVTTATTATIKVSSSIDMSVLNTLAVYQDQKASGTGGGTNVAGAWTTRDINTETYDPLSLASVASNQITPTIDCVLSWRCPFYRVDQFKTRLWNVTDSVLVAYGTQGNSFAASAGDSAESFGSAKVVAGKAYRVDYYTATALATTGLGTFYSAPGGVEIYSEVKLERL